MIFEFLFLAAEIFVLFATQANTAFALVWVLATIYAFLAAFLAKDIRFIPNERSTYNFLILTGIMAMFIRWSIILCLIIAAVLAYGNHKEEHCCLIERVDQNVEE